MNPAKILVVDDTPRNVKFLVDLLGVKGYSVVTAASGAEALKQVERQLDWRELIRGAGPR